jgi:Arc/MetJ family transcription regulator
VFTVLLVVLSIVFAVMTISVVAQTNNWKDTATKYELNARIADTNLRNMIAAGAAVEATSRDAVRSHLARIGEMETQMQANNAELAKLRTDVARVDAEKSSAEAMNRGLLAQLEAARSGETEIRKQLADIERRNIELERRNIDLNDRVNEQTAQIYVLDEQKRQFEQQLNILRDEAEKLGNQGRRAAGGGGVENPAGAAMRNVVPLTAGGSSAIRGSVVEVKDSLVTISNGSADGVKKDMVFVVSRNDQYVGDLKISHTEPNRAAGRMIQSTVSPMTGDQVMDAIGAKAPR